MTPLQRQVYDYITEFWDTNGYSPTFRQIADYMDRSVSFAHGSVMALSRKGLVLHEPYRARSMIPVPLKDKIEEAERLNSAEEGARQHQEQQNEA
jgi:SOS-response transcriptional repressor LexA